MRKILFLLAILLATLACTVGPATAPTETPAFTSTAQANGHSYRDFRALPEYTTIGYVNVRNYADEVIDVLDPGERVRCQSRGDWCIGPQGFVWAGCLSPNPQNLGCKKQ